MVKLFLMSSDETGNIDPTVLNQVLRHLPLTDDLSSCDAVVVPVSYFPNYKFNHKLTSLKKPIILVDYTEYGWNWDFNVCNVLGTGAYQKCNHINTPEYAMLDKWAQDFPAKLHLKRDLRGCDRSDALIPISFLCNIPAEPIQTKEEYNARPIEVFFSWGYSHPSRRRLHGEIFSKADSKGIHILDHWDQDGHFEGSHNWATIHAPHYCRRPMSEIMNWQRRAKISVSLPGAGITCFRSAECVNTIMALHQDSICWPYDWIHEVNCIRLIPWNEFEELWKYCQRGDLYDIYLKGQETLYQYRPENFSRNYTIPNIERIL